jgi:hypothetical protein
MYRFAKVFFTVLIFSTMLFVACDGTNNNSMDGTTPTNMVAYVPTYVPADSPYTYWQIAMGAALEDILNRKEYRLGYPNNYDHFIIEDINNSGTPDLLLFDSDISRLSFFRIVGNGFVLDRSFDRNYPYDLIWKYYDNEVGGEVFFHAVEGDDFRMYTPLDFNDNDVLFGWRQIDGANVYYVEGVQVSHEDFNRFYERFEPIAMDIYQLSIWGMATAGLPADPARILVE